MASREQKEAEQRRGQSDGEWRRDYESRTQTEVRAIADVLGGPAGYNPPSEPEAKAGYDASFEQGRTGGNVGKRS